MVNEPSVFQPLKFYCLRNLLANVVLIEGSKTLTSSIRSFNKNTHEGLQNLVDFAKSSTKKVLFFVVIVSVISFMLGVVGWSEGAG